MSTADRAACGFSRPCDGRREELGEIVLEPDQLRAGLVAGAASSVASPLE